MVFFEKGVPKTRLCVQKSMRRSVSLCDHFLVFDFRFEIGVSTIISLVSWFSTSSLTAILKSASYYTCARQTCLVKPAKRTRHRNSNTRTGPMLDAFWSVPGCISNFTKHDQTASNTIKRYQARWPKDKMCGHQTCFDSVSSLNILRVIGALLEVRKTLVIKIVKYLNMAAN